MKTEKYEFDWWVMALGALICCVAAVATPYITLKLGMSTDLSMGGMFLVAYMMARRFTPKAMAIQLNIIQTMIGMVSGIAFMVVILAAFFYIQVVFKRDIGFNPTPFQMFCWLWLSANLGVFMGLMVSRSILKDTSLPWPGPVAGLNVINALSDNTGTAAATSKKRNVLSMSAAGAGFLTFLRDGLGVIQPMTGNPLLNMSFSLEFMAIGIGMLVPLSVGLSGLLGVWIVNNFGERVAQLAALAGTTATNWDQCVATLGGLASFADAEKAQAVTFLTANCGEAIKFANAKSHFGFVVKWMMWPATAMMIFAALTSVAIPVVGYLRNKRKDVQGTAQEQPSLADESVPLWWIIGGIGVSVVLLVWLTSTWFDMPWPEVLLAVAIQPVLILAGLRVLGITGMGPVSLMANATQFLFGLIWPAQIRSNLSAAYISASPQSAAENLVPSFWVAQRLGGRFKTLILAQLIVIPIGAVLTPIMFNLLQETYGIGLNPGQLSAPTGLKIATLAIVMEQGLSALPRGALTASLIAAIIGVVFELLLAVRKREEDGSESARFWWVPIPSSLGFALILPPPLTIGIAIGSVFGTIWKKLAAPQEGGSSYELFAAPLASGLIAGEAIVASILLPALSALLMLF